MRKNVWAWVAAVGIVLAGCGHSTPYTAPPAPAPTSGAAPWPAPADRLEAARDAGLTPDTHEYFTFHIHAHLDVFVNGRPVLVPAGLGIKIDDPAVQHGESQYGTGYGGISMCAKPCIAPLHTHNADGIVHVEAMQKEDFRLGQFFTEWGVKLDSSCVGGYCRPTAAFAVFVNGKRYTGNPADIGFADHQEIAIVIGSPPASIPQQFPATPSPIPAST